MAVLWILEPYKCLPYYKEADLMKSFRVRKDYWYACELIGDLFSKQTDQCSYSPIKIYDIKPHKTGNRKFTLLFFHANYPWGVQDKEYRLQTLERGETFILAKSTQHDSTRVLLIYEITNTWIKKHFPSYDPQDNEIQNWCTRNLY